MRIGNGLGVGFGGAAAPAVWTPASVANCTLGQLYDSTASMFTTDVGATPAANTDPVGRVVALAGPNGLQSSSGLRPTRQSDGLQFDTVDDRLALASTVSYTGDFCLYAAFDRVAGNLYPLAATGDQSGVLIHSGTIYVQTATTAYTWVAATTGKMLIRARRVGGTLFVRRTGFSETNAGAFAGTLNINVVGYWGVYAVPNGDAGNRVYAGFGFNADPAAGDLTLIDSWFSARGYTP